MAASIRWRSFGSCRCRTCSAAQQQPAGTGSRSPVWSCSGGAGTGEPPARPSATVRCVPPVPTVRLTRAGTTSPTDCVPSALARLDGRPAPRVPAAGVPGARTRRCGEAELPGRLGLDCGDERCRPDPPPAAARLPAVCARRPRHLCARRRPPHSQSATAPQRLGR